MERERQELERTKKWETRDQFIVRDSQLYLLG